MCHADADRLAVCPGGSLHGLISACGGLSGPSRRTEAARSVLGRSNNATLCSDRPRGAAVLAGVAIPAAAAGASSGPAVSVVRSGLNNPRHLTLTSDGLWVAQPARAARRDVQLRHRPVHRRTGNTKYCVGRTGAVSLIRHGHIAASVPLPSVIQTDSSEVAGPAAATFSHNRSAVIMQDVLVNSHGVNALPKPAGKLFGQLLIRSGHKVAAVNLAALRGGPSAVGLEPGTVPGETTYDSDPYDVVAYHGGYLVADAAANSLLQVTPSGRIHLLARFRRSPRRPRPGFLARRR